MDKKEMRRYYLSRRSELTDSEWRDLSDQICQKVINTPWFNEASQLLMYMPFRREVDIRPIIERAWKAGKNVYLPRCEPETKQLLPYRVQSFDDLQPGIFGLLEPDPVRVPRGDMRSLDVVIVPGVVFDRRGYRIGYGGGYYDRFLPMLSETTYTVGVAFSVQVVETVPYERYDQPIHALVTDNESLIFNEANFKERS